MPRPLLTFLFLQLMASLIVTARAQPSTKQHLEQASENQEQAAGRSLSHLLGDAPTAALAAHLHALQKAEKHDIEMKAAAKERAKQDRQEEAENRRKREEARRMSVTFPLGLGRNPVTVVPERASRQWWGDVEAGLWEPETFKVHACINMFRNTLHRSGNSGSKLG
jgi:hypothetical protein